MNRKQFLYSFIMNVCMVITNEYANLRKQPCYQFQPNLTGRKLRWALPQIYFGLVQDPVYKQAVQRKLGRFEMQWKTCLEIKLSKLGPCMFDALKCTKNVLKMACAENLKRSTCILSTKYTRYMGSVDKSVILRKLGDIMIKCAVVQLCLLIE